MAARHRPTASGGAKRQIPASRSPHIPFSLLSHVRNNAAGIAPFLLSLCSVRSRRRPVDSAWLRPRRAAFPGGEHLLYPFSLQHTSSNSTDGLWCPDERYDGAAVGPLTGARARQKLSVPPSSGPASGALSQARARDERQQLGSVPVRR